MDLNNEIIEGVRQYPSLHNNKSDLDERKQAWIQLAEKLKVHEQYLKIRWHALLQGYQRDVNFKYTNDMQFVPRNPVTPPKLENWPEFIITEEDLQDDTSEEQVEFVLLESEDESNSTHLKQELVKEMDCVYPETSKQMEDEKVPHNDLRNKTDTKNVTQKIKTTRKQNLPQGKKVEESSTHKSLETDVIRSTKAEDITLKVEEKMAAVDVNKNNELCVQETKEVVERSNPLIAERCEDVIFGELVSAMLKRMDENKKNNIKKEIMNLLFS